MKRIILLFSLLPLALGIYIWGRDGWEIAFWQTSVANRIEIPIVEGMPELGTQTQVIWEERFISGIETPLVGLVASVLLFLFFYIKLRR